MVGPDGKTQALVGMGLAMPLVSTLHVHVRTYLCVRVYSRLINSPKYSCHVY